MIPYFRLRLLIPVLVCATLQYACQNNPGSRDDQTGTDQETTKVILPDTKPVSFAGLSHEDSMNAGLLVSVDEYSIEDESCNYIADLDTIVSPDGAIRDYELGNGCDHWPASWWTPKQHRDGVGAVYEMRFPDEIPICAIELFGGAADNDFDEGTDAARYTDLYHLNNRVKAGFLEFSDGTKVPFSREDEQHWITIDIPDNIKSSYLRLTVTEVYKGSKWNDLALGDVQVLTNSEEFGYILDGIAKPVIYLYPEKPEQVQVRLGLHGKLGTTWPSYDANNGWQVLAEPDGILNETGNGRQHRYLFWEGQAHGKWNMETGFCIPGNKTGEFLADALQRLGLNDTEANDFISYWLPMMEGNAFNIIHFAGNEYTDLAPLSVTPKPQTMIRVFMVWAPSAQQESLPPQKLSSPDRSGFTVVEWGGCQVLSGNLLSAK